MPDTLLALREQKLGPQHLEVAQSLNNLGLVLESRGDYTAAKGMYERALAVREEALGSEHRDVATVLHNLGLIYWKQGDYTKAETHHERALSIRERALGREHLDIAESLDPLAGLCTLRGEYGKAEALYERALAIREKQLGLDHLKVAQSLNNLGGLYSEQGEYSKAELLHQRSLEIVRKELGHDHLYAAIVLNNLGHQSHMQGNYSKAESLHEEALRIREHALGPEHPYVATSLNNLGLTHQKQGRYEEAATLLDRALSIRKKALGPTHPHVATTLNNLALLYQESAEYGRAETAFENALSIREEIFAPTHPQIALSTGNLASFHASQGRREPALELFERTLEIQHVYLTQTLLFAEEPRRLKYALTAAALYHKVLSFHLQVAPDHRGTAELALNTLLGRKALTLELGARTLDSIRRSLPQRYRHLLDDLASSRARYSYLSTRGRGALPAEKLARELAAIEQEQHRIWQSLSEHSSIVRTRSTPATIEDIQQAIPPDSVLIEFARYFPAYAHPTSSRVDRYSAYLVFPDHIDWYDLGPAGVIDTQIGSFREALATKSDSATAISQNLYRLLIKPISGRLGQTRNVFIAPDSALSLIPFGALHDGNRYLIEQRFLVYLTTGRDLLRYSRVGVNVNDAVLAVANPAGANLPGTEQEVNIIAELLPNTRILTRSNATEAQVTAQTRPWILHLATHGFFKLIEPERSPDALTIEQMRTTTLSSGQVPRGLLDNPMLYAGVVLATTEPQDDSAAGGDTSKTTNDGRLTAYEVSGWDLRGTELVVLSACDTGLGEPRTGEGVIGLRRAFTLAGAQTQVMSLWKIDDSATTILMGEYYKRLLAGEGRAKAMHETQLKMLYSEGDSHPGNWASFIVVGNWKSLSPVLLPRSGGPPVESRRGCRASVAEKDLPTMVLVALLCAIFRRRRNDAVA